MIQNLKKFSFSKYNIIYGDTTRLFLFEEEVLLIYFSICYYVQYIVFVPLVDYDGGCRELRKKFRMSRCGNALLMKHAAALIDESGSG